MEFGVAERLMLLSLLVPVEGDVTALRIVRDLQQELGFSDDEKVALKFETQGAATTWNITAERPKVVAIGPAAQEIIATQLKMANAARKLTVAQLELYEKFVEDDEAGGDAGEAPDV